jgi:hypothetical protein
MEILHRKPEKIISTCGRSPTRIAYTIIVAGMDKKLSPVASAGQMMNKGRCLSRRHGGSAQNFCAISPAFGKWGQSLFDSPHLPQSPMEFG